MATFQEEKKEIRNIIEQKENLLNNIEHNKNKCLFNNIKSKYILKQIFEYLQQKIYLK